MKTSFLSIVIFVSLFAPLALHAAYDASFQKGFNFPSWWFDSYSQTWSDQSFQSIPDYGPTWIAVGPFWYQKDQYATAITAHKTRTANDAGVEHVIRMAHDRGWKVMLKPLVDAENGIWRGRFQPKNPDAWFASYTTMAVHYAKMAERLNVESYLIGAEYELLSVPTYADKWRTVVRAVRAHYSGEIGYGANWGKKGKAEFEKVNWWDALDVIGIHAYFPISTANSATFDDMVAGWSSIRFEGRDEHWIDQIEAVQKKYGKPVVFSEAGYKACDGATRIPWWCNPKAGVDLQEQSDGNESLLKVFENKPWLRGVFFWMWNIKPWYGGPTDKDHNLNTKPALQAIAKYWGTQSSSVPEAPPAPAQDTSEEQKDTREQEAETRQNDSETTSQGASPAQRDLLPPRPVTNVSVEAGDASVTIRWTDPEDDDLSSIIIFRNRGGTTPIDGGNIYSRVNAGGQTFTDSNAHPGETYQYLLRAEDMRGNIEENLTVVMATIPTLVRSPQFVFAPPSGGTAATPVLPSPYRILAAEVVLAPPRFIPPTQLIYGIPRKALSEEQTAARILRDELHQSFGESIPLQAKYWSTYVNARLYGGYPVDVIVHAIPRGGEGVHPLIPWSAWKNLHRP